VVLIAGFTASAETWQLQRSALLAADHRVPGLDRRSHGASANPVYGQRIARHGKDIRDVVGRVAVPSLFIAGRESQLWPCEHATAAAATHSRATTLTIEDSGHGVNVDQPDRVDEALLKFLAGLA
jgi:pimeloyl-ACP methyl ester carboxylesterase